MKLEDERDVLKEVGDQIVTDKLLEQEFMKALQRLKKDTSKVCAPDDEIPSEVFLNSVNSAVATREFYSLLKLIWRHEYVPRLSCSLKEVPMSLQNTDV